MHGMAAGKKLIDTFKSKAWYHVFAPKFLSEAEVGTVPSLDDEHIMNRIIIVPLKEITKDISHMYVSVKLRVFEIKGKNAYTKFIGHSVSREYLRTLVRRRKDVINLVFSTKSKDDLEFRVKIVVVTNSLCSGPLKTAMRHKIFERISARAAQTELGTFVQDVISGKIPSELTAEMKKMASIRRVEISKTTLKEDFDTEEVVALKKDGGKESAIDEVTGGEPAQKEEPESQTIMPAATHA